MKHRASLRGALIVGEGIREARREAQGFTEKGACCLGGYQRGALCCVGGQEGETSGHCIWVEPQIAVLSGWWVQIVEDGFVP